MVKHILKDGKEVKDITGHVVKVKDAPVAYEVIRRRKNGQQNHI